MVEKLAAASLGSNKVKYSHLPFAELTDGESRASPDVLDLAVRCIISTSLGTLHRNIPCSLLSSLTGQPWEARTRTRTRPGPTRFHRGQKQSQTPRRRRRRRQRQCRKPRCPRGGRVGSCPFGGTATLGHVLLRDPVPCVFGVPRLFGARRVWKASCLRCPPRWNSLGDNHRLETDRWHHDRATRAKTDSHRAEHALRRTKTRTVQGWGLLSPAKR
ncbi:hypothetical protein EDB80DRAFT_22926 [Ilyonectria destructans]|nr:hypothetical protein EDB80DRAFT_22926 [Ilyonectria destructans]